MNEEKSAKRTQEASKWLSDMAHNKIQTFSMETVSTKKVIPSNRQEVRNGNQWQDYLEMGKRLKREDCFIVKRTKEVIMSCSDVEAKAWRKRYNVNAYRHGKTWRGDRLTLTVQPDKITVEVSRNQTVYNPIRANYPERRRKDTRKFNLWGNDRYNWSFTEERTDRINQRCRELANRLLK